jgi:hypothetical protein
MSMITVFVEFDLPDPVPADKAQALFASTAPKYQGIPGLLRKYYVSGEGGQSAGGIYLWESREQAEGFYDAAWFAMVRERYGAEPRVRYLDTPVVVDNVAGTIIGA